MHIFCREYLRGITAGLYVCIMETNKTNSQDGAFACASDYGHQAGLTKREYFAAMAMQGLMSQANCNISQITDNSYQQLLARYCVDMADVLIAQLNKKDSNL